MGSEDAKNKPSIKSFLLKSNSSLTEKAGNSFNFWNGDKYTGQFAVLKEKQKIVMEGKGVYETSDGERYEGKWENDCLKEAEPIAYPDKSEFWGGLEEMVMRGPGKYKFKQKVEIEGIFINNNFFGNVYLKDPNGNKWKGEATAKEHFITFQPLHAFWQSLFLLPNKYQIFKGEADEGSEQEGFGFSYND